MASVDAILNYADPPDGKPAYYLYPAPPEAEVRAPGTARHHVVMHDLRETGEQLNLDVQGFKLVEHRCAILDFYDPEEVRRVYYPQAEQLVMAHTGAAEVLAFDHNVRNRARAELDKDGAQLPVKSVHNDYTETSTPQRVRDLLPDRADELLARRFAVVNVWRPIVGPVLRSPLGVCDARSMQLDDFVPTDLVYRDRVGEVYTVRYNPDHRWFYCSQMQPSEVLLLKCYDSEQSVAARFTSHSAFELKDANEDAPHRESIEVRTLVFFA